MVYKGVNRITDSFKNGRITAHIISMQDLLPYIVNIIWHIKWLVE